MQEPSSPSAIANPAIANKSEGKTQNPNRRKKNKRASKMSGHPMPPNMTTPSNKYKTAMCRDLGTKGFCSRGAGCTYAHNEDELERYRAFANAHHITGNSNFKYMPPMPPVHVQQMPQALNAPHMFQRFPLHAPPPRGPLPRIENYNVQPMPSQQMPELHSNQEFVADNQRAECIPPPANYAAAVMRNPGQLAMSQSAMIVPIPDRPYYGHYGAMVTMHDEAAATIQFARPEFVNTVYQNAPTAGPIAGFQGQEQNMPPAMPNIFVPVQHEAQRGISPYTFEDLNAPAFANVPRERQIEASWPAANIYGAQSGDRRIVGADRIGTAAERIASSDLAKRADDEELEEELQALERRIDTEFKSTD